MIEGRQYHSCGLIPSGDGSGYEVLAVGGNGGGETPNENLKTSTEIFNLETETWRTGVITRTWHYKHFITKIIFYRRGEPQNTKSL